MQEKRCLLEKRTLLSPSDDNHNIQCILEVEVLDNNRLCIVVVVGNNCPCTVLVVVEEGNNCLCTVAVAAAGNGCPCMVAAVSNSCLCMEVAAVEVGNSFPCMVVVVRGNGCLCTVLVLVMEAEAEAVEGTEVVVVDKEGVETAVAATTCNQDAHLIAAYSATYIVGKASLFMAL